MFTQALSSNIEDTCMMLKCFLVRSVLGFEVEVPLQPQYRTLSSNQCNYLQNVDQLDICHSRTRHVCDLSVSRRNSLQYGDGDND